jgi:hypothetical protein
MANPTLYKKKSINDVRNRNTFALTSDETTRVNSVVSTFFDLLKAEHMS